MTIDYVAVAAWLGSAGAVGVLGNILITHMRGKSEAERAEPQGAAAASSAVVDMTLRLAEMGEKEMARQAEFLEHSAKLQQTISDKQSRNLQLQIELSKQTRQVAVGKLALSHLNALLTADSSNFDQREADARQFLRDVANKEKAGLL